MYNEKIIKDAENYDLTKVDPAFKMAVTLYDNKREVYLFENLEDAVNYSKENLLQLEEVNIIINDLRYSVTDQFKSMIK